MDELANQGSFPPWNLVVIVGSWDRNVLVECNSHLQSLKFKLCTKVQRSSFGLLQAKMSCSPNSFHGTVELR